MPFVGCCALVYFWTLRFSRIGDFYTLRLGFFGNLDLRIINSSKQPRRFSKKSFIHYYTHLVTPRDTAEDNTFIVIENPPDHHKKTTGRFDEAACCV